ncbi:MAG TPA: hypothetical protein VFQ44_02000 [Streptosporangiaceae bacterium]|nr:hypothetical protein [Streptosporangiaceae bacterium]
MALPPYPVPPAPRTWSPGDQVLTSRLRADLGNAALLFANRPLFAGSQTTTGQAVSGDGVPVVIDTELVDGWQAHTIPSAIVAARFPGWYLVDGYIETTPISSADTFRAFLETTQSGVAADPAGGRGPGNGVNDQGYTVSDLVQMDPATGDHLALFALCDAACDIVTATLKSEWVALPTSLGYATGTVVPAPAPAAPWPPGRGTVIASIGGIPAGATSVTVQSAAGIVPGGTLGLDYLAGVAVSPMAETVTVTSVAGNTIGITAALYPHGGTASPGAVAVPVSAVFLNQQVRDLINFSAYPPVFRAYNSGSLLLPTSAFSVGSPIGVDTVTVDNFGGFAGSSYEFPVSGVYYVAGVIAGTGFLPTSGTLVAGLSISGGQVLWGDGVTTSSTQVAATVRRHVRVTAGQTVQLYGSQNSGETQSLLFGSDAGARLIAVFRSF